MLAVSAMSICLLSEATSTHIDGMYFDSMWRPCWIVCKSAAWQICRLQIARRWRWVGTLWCWKVLCCTYV